MPRARTEHACCTHAASCPELEVVVITASSLEITPATARPRIHNEIDPCARKVTSTDGVKHSLR